MSKLLVANWKANPDSVGRAVRLAKGIESASRVSKRVDTVVAPPSVFLTAVGKVLKHAKLGAQNTFWEDVGPYTGEVSWHQLKHCNVSVVILGHSERRRWLKETDEMINKKVLAVLKAGLKVILCVGEPLAVRKKGLSAAKRFVKTQLHKDLKNVPSFKFHDSRLVIAYEPIWAIGTGRADKPNDTVAMAKFIKRTLAGRFKIQDSRFKILYGGSVNSKNVINFLRHREIDGALVGGASLNAEEFKKIIIIASHVS